MKAHTLHLEKALGAALFVLLLCVAGSKNALAQNEAATLQHNGNISVFFGTDALVNAAAAATDGDTITLSSGTFNGCTFTLPIVVHGAGCVADPVSGTAPTRIMSTSHCSANNLVFEGIHFNSTILGTSYDIYENVHFTKCNIDKFDLIYFNSGGYINGLYMEDCIVKNFEYKGYGGTFINCVLEMQNFYHASSTDYNVFFNTILLFSYLHYQRITHSVVNNCILTFDGPTSIDLENSTFNNCIAIRPEGVTIFENQTNNMEVATFEEVFQTFTGTITFDNSYQLTDNIATSFLGNDNTEVGIYGGMAPYNTKLPYQIIKNCKVASRTDENQQLGVQIELNTNN